MRYECARAGHLLCECEVELLLCNQVPIQKMPAVRPSPAASHMLSSSSSRQSSQHATNVQSPAQPAQARKRAKQAAGAGTVLLALFSFVIFLGPLGPLAGQGLWSGPAPGLGHLGSSQGLPASDSMTPHIGGGRVLMAVGTNTSDMLDSSSQENQTVLVIPANQSFFEEVLSIAEGSGESTGSENRPGQGQITGEAWWPRVMEAGHVEPSKSIVLRPSNKKAESQALQGLKVNSQWSALLSGPTWQALCALQLDICIGTLHALHC